MNRIVPERGPLAATESGLFFKLALCSYQRLFILLDAATWKANAASPRSMLVHVKQDQAAVGARRGGNGGQSHMDLVIVADYAPILQAYGFPGYAQPVCDKHLVLLQNLPGLRRIHVARACQTGLQAMYE